MAYQDQEISIQDGTPYFLYEFNTEVGIFRFIDYPIDFDWNGETWLYRPISHGKIKQGKEISKNSVTITMPIGQEYGGFTFTDLFFGWSPDFIITVTIRRGHFGSSDTLVYWKGRIASHQLKEDTIELSCESIFTSLRRAGLRARVQRNCRHAIYSNGCGVVKEDFATHGEMTALSGLTLTITEASSQVDGWFNGGIAEFPDGSYRLITNHVGTQITIDRANRYINDNFGASGWGRNWGAFWGGFKVIIYPGCKRNLADCRDKFNNKLNNGAFRWLPRKNPMGGSSIF